MRRAASPTASGAAAGGPHLDYIIKHFHIGIYGKRERESGFFSFWVWISRLGFLMFTFYKAMEAWAVPAAASTLAPPIRHNLHRTRHFYVFLNYYVLCRVRVRFCWFELSFVGGGFRLIHWLSIVVIMRLARRSQRGRGPRARSVWVGVRAPPACARASAPPPPPCCLPSYHPPCIRDMSHPIACRIVSVCPLHNGRGPIDAQPRPAAPTRHGPDFLIYYSRHSCFNGQISNQAPSSIRLILINWL